MSENKPWYQKYKATLNNYIWPSKEVENLIKSWIDKKSIQNVLLAGPPGLGKTNLAEIIISELGIDQGDVLYLNGVSHNSVETVRTVIQEFCELGGWSDSKIVFFDEADNLSFVAQGALRTIINDYADSVKFILTCNFPHRIMDAIASSRLMRIDFESLNQDDFLERLISVLLTEEVDISGDKIHILFSVVENCYPDMRKALNILQASVRDGNLYSVGRVKSSTQSWEMYFRKIFRDKSEPLAELINVRNVLATLSTDEMEVVYSFLYQNISEFFGDLQIKALYIINNGQTRHRNALLPDFILLEIFLRLLTLNYEK